MPTTPYFWRFSEPMLPTTASPACTPMPISSWGRPWARFQPLTVAIALLHGEGAAQGALLVVILGQGRVEDHEDGVADELVDGAAVGQDHLGHGAQVVVEQAHDVLGGQLGGEGGEAAQIGHEHGHGLLPAAELQAAGLVEQCVDDVVAEVAAEDADHAVAVVQGRCRLVEALSEHHGHDGAGQTDHEQAHSPDEVGAGGAVQAAQVLGGVEADGRAGRTGQDAAIDAEPRLQAQRREGQRHPVDGQKGGSHDVVALQELQA